jgi:hypothetical protein
LQVNSRSIALLLGALSVSCDAKKSSDVSTTPLAASNVAALGVDADLPPPPDPAPSAGDLASDVAAFTTLDACVANHAVKIDPLIGDALLSFGYDTFLQDACRQVDAVKSKDPKKCEAIVASELARHCKATVAMIAGKPDDCPFADSDDANGRMPTCVAVALRDPRLCVAELGTQGAACTATVLHDPTKCDVVPKAEIAACRRSGERLASSLPPPQLDLAALPNASAKLTLTALNGSQTPNPSSATLQSDVASGVAITLGTISTTFSFGPSHQAAAFPHEVPPESPLRIGLEMHVANSAKQETNIRSVDLEVPGGVRLDSTQLHDSPKIKIVQLAKERGGPVEFVIDGEMGSAPQAFAFHLEVKTFVRDVITAHSN